MLSWSNSAPPGDATDNTTGAATVYDRSTADGALRTGGFSPFELTLQVLNAAGVCITERTDVKAYLCALYTTIWGWNSSDWAEALSTMSDAPRAEDILRTKAEAFWENSAQYASERVFGVSARESSLVYLFGPKAMDADGNLLPEHDDESGIPDAAELRVTTRIDGARDPLMSISRTIVYIARRGEFPISAASRIDYLIHVPSGHRVASAHGEVLDWRPSIGGKRTDQAVTIKASNPPRASDRYPDFGRLSVPLRHLLLQGEVKNPKESEGAPGHDYTDEAALQAAFNLLISQMRTKEGSASVAQRLKPFLTEKYYYSYAEGGQGVDAYACYILGEHAVGKGWEGAFGDIALVLGESQW
jgi:hypothetical protein